MRVLAAPDADDLLGGRLFDPPAARNRDSCLEPFRHLHGFLAASGIQTSTFDQGDPAQADRVIFFELKRFTPLYRALEVTMPEQRVLVIWEPPAVTPANHDFDLHALFGTVLTWNDDLVDGRKYRKVQYPVPRYPRPDPVRFSDRRLVVNITSHKGSKHPDSLYLERLRAIRFFERACPDQFDLYGTGWPQSRYPSYRGTVASKQEVLGRYRFALCYENMRSSNGYITEKVFDAMQAGTVPVYLGAENATRYLWPETFIDRRKFGSYEELCRHLAEMEAPRHAKYLDRIREYLDSPDFADFLPERFAERVLDALVRPGPAAPAGRERGDPERGRRKVEARYLNEESRRVFDAGRAREFRAMYHRLLRLEPRRALGSYGLVARYAASLVGLRRKGVSSAKE
jgi:hypothetical protein